MPDTATPQGRTSRTRAAPKPFAPHASSGHGADFLVVAIGASAGGLEACTKLLSALPASSGMAFILVQHLDPTHKSLLVDLLAEYTALAVTQAVDGMQVEREHLYVIPPASYLFAGAGALRLSPPETRDGAPHGARLPFDALLHSTAGEYGPRAACVVLSGTGADGSAGLQAVKAAGGLVVAQDPAEAGFGGMPRIAIGLVDAVLSTSRIQAALANHAQAGDGSAEGPAFADAPGRVPPGAPPNRRPDWLRRPPPQVGSGRAGPLHAQPPRSNAGGATTALRRPTPAPACGQHRPQALWCGRSRRRFRVRSTWNAGGGEWLIEKHGAKTRRFWRTLHIRLDADTGQIVAATLTRKEVDDGSQVGPLLDHA